MAAKRELFITYSFTAKAKGKHRIRTLLDGGFVDAVSKCVWESGVSDVLPYIHEVPNHNSFFILIFEYSWLI